MLQAQYAYQQAVEVRVAQGVWRRGHVVECQPALTSDEQDSFGVLVEGASGTGYYDAKDIRPVEA